MPAKNVARTPARPFAPSPLPNCPVPATPAFASAADALRAKIRACAARSFAAQHKAAGKTAGSQENDDGEKSAAAIATGRSVRRAGQEGPRAYSEDGPKSRFDIRRAGRRFSDSPPRTRAA